jgi:hypothetical protein
MTPHEVKFALDRKLLELARGGLVPVITGVHSVVVEDNTVSVGFDIVPDPTGDGILFFEFEIPALVSRDDLRAFGEWLATSGYDGAVH